MTPDENSRFLVFFVKKSQNFTDNQQIYPKLLYLYIGEI